MAGSPVEILYLQLLFLANHGQEGSLTFVVAI
jgi:hypothetical protein